MVVAGVGKILAADSRDGLFQGRLIPFNLHHIMGLFFLHQILSRVALRMEGIHSHNLSGDVQGIEQIPDLGNLVGFALDVHLSNDLPGPVDESREEMHGARTRAMSRSA